MKKRFYAVLLSIMMLLSLALNGTAVQAEGTPKTITGFATLGDEYSNLLYADPPDKKELDGEMPKSLQVYLDSSSTLTDVTVSSWTCSTYAPNQEGEFVFTPVFDTTAYVLDKKEDGTFIDCPTVTVSILGADANGLAEAYSKPAAEPVSLPASNSNLDPVYSPDLSSMPPLRDQGGYGDCWAFSTIFLTEESAIKQQQKGTDVDLSELHLSYFAKYMNRSGDQDPLGGMEGDQTQYNPENNNSASYLDAGNVFDRGLQTLLNWCGSADEEDMKYSDAELTLADNGYDINGTYPPDDLQFSLADLHLQDVYQMKMPRFEDGDVYDEDNQCYTDEVSVIKQYIRDCGAVGIGYYEAGDKYYNNDKNAFFYDGEQTSGHAVAIVGWDDTKPLEDFDVSDSKVVPAHNGAWLVRNSYGGQGYSHEGYFWMSYFTHGLRQNAYAVVSSPAGTYDHNYQYDGSNEFYTRAAWYDDQIYGGDTATSRPEVAAANVFKAHGNKNGAESLKAVSFQTYGTSNADYTIQIYTGNEIAEENDPTAGTKQTEQTGTITASGCYTVSLDTAVPLQEDVPFSVVVKLKKEGGDVSFASEQATGDNGDTLLCSASAGQSYISTDGGTNWTDFGAIQPEGSYSSNIRIKAFTNDDGSPAPTAISLDHDNLGLVIGTGTTKTDSTQQLTASLQPEGAAGKVTWTSGNTDVAAVSEDGFVTAIAAGSATITAECGSLSATCAVTVTDSSQIVPVTGLTLSDAAATLTVGGTKTLTATVAPENATDKRVTWTSDNPNVASVDAAGEVTARKAGTAVITAAAGTGGGIRAACTVTVNNSEGTIPLNDIHLSSTAVSLCIGSGAAPAESTATLSVQFDPENTTESRTLQWGSFDTKTARVDQNGVITAVGEGTTAVYVLCGHFFDICTVNVTKKTAPSPQDSTGAGGTTSSSSDTPSAGGSLPSGVKLQTVNYKTLLNTWPAIIGAENTLQPTDVPKSGIVSGITVLQVRNAQLTNGDVPKEAVDALSRNGTAKALQLLLPGDTALTFLSAADNKGFTGLNVINDQSYGKSDGFVTKTLNFRKKAMFGTAAILVTRLPGCVPESYVSIYIERDGKNVLFTTLQTDRYGYAAMMINETAKYTYVYELQRS
jgi:uncharacterized protein YjdB/C1A family cysteine protease